MTQSFCIIFGNEPVWLLALRPQFVKKVYVSGSISYAHFNSILIENNLSASLYHNVIKLLGTNIVHFSSPPSQDLIYLISGSISFLNDKSLELGTKKGIYVTEQHTRLRRTLPTTHILMKRINHAMVGGITTFEGVYCYTPDPSQPLVSSLQRTLGDYLDFSLPPNTLKDQSTCLHHKGQLPLQHIQRLVYFPTHFSASGFGYRYLTQAELKNIFGLEWTAHHFKVNSSTYPTQILDALLHSYLQPVTTSLDSPCLPPPCHHDTGFTYFPSINATLSNLWFQQVDISNSAVKNDEAVVDYSVWNNRIILVFPQITSNMLNVFRRFFMQCYCRRLYLEFLQYIKTKYTKLWEVQSHKNRIYDWYFILSLIHI